MEKNSELISGLINKMYILLLTFSIQLNCQITNAEIGEC